MLLEQNAMELGQGVRPSIVERPKDALAILDRQRDHSGLKRERLLEERLPGNQHDYQEPYWESPAWSPKGREIALIGDFARLHVANVDGTELRGIAKAEYERPAWSTEGDWLAFVKRGDLYLIRPDGTGLRRLTRTRADENSPAWLPRMPG